MYVRFGELSDLLVICLIVLVFMIICVCMSILIFLELCLGLGFEGDVVELMK